ncbi:MAG: hypothetical protein R2712_30865 [Vicinamibacterales bacterium]
MPALLNWHFTDRYYHTNLDTIDKVSAAEMGHVAAIVSTTAAPGDGGGADVEPVRAPLRQVERRRATRHRVAQRRVR